MKKVMPIGIDDFKKVRDGYYFVDKTFFIKSLVEPHSDVILCTRPRRFGKTLMMSMVKYFFDIKNAVENRKLFTGLAIEIAGDDYMSKQGKYPVIFLTMKELKNAMWQATYEDIKSLIEDIYAQFDYLLESDRLTLREKKEIGCIINGGAEDTIYRKSLKNLTVYLYKHHGIKPILLIDEYDVPIQYGFEHGYYEDAIAFMKVWLDGALKGNVNLEFALLTGVLRIAKESIFSDLNNLDVCSLMVEKYNDVFGFTMHEVEMIAKNFQAENKLAEMKEWYDGYNFSGREIYNPWSILKYIDAKFTPQAYWVNTSGNGIIKQLLKNANHAQSENLLLLLSGKTITASIREGIIYTDMYNDQDALYTLLMTTGYLKIVEQKSTDGLTTLCSLAIPNREIRAVYRYEVLDKMRQGLPASNLLMMMENLLAGNVAEFSEMLSQYLMVMVSTYDTASKESFYHGFMLGMVALLVPTYSVKSNRESGYGRFDLAMFPQDKTKNGVIMEFKTASSEAELERQAQLALAQIEEKNYLADFKEQGIKIVQRYGIAFWGKHVKLIRS